jgi:Isoleucyl-tRNA synthetase
MKVYISGAKPVLWSVVEKTALGDAEVEYEDHTSNTIYVKFLINKCDDKDLIGSNIVIWTTTPWTIPGNRALVYGKDLEYSLIIIEEVEKTSLGKVNDKLFLAKDLVANVLNEIGVKKFNVIKNFKGLYLASCECDHPFNKVGYDFIVKPFHGDFVNLEIRYLVIVHN